MGLVSGLRMRERLSGRGTELISDRYDRPVAENFQFHSEEDLIIALGLDPDFKGLQGADWPRATGRTTKLLVRALIVSQMSPITVVGFNYRYTRQLQSDLENMALSSGLLLDNLVSLDKMLKSRGPSRDHMILFDHSVNEDRSY